MNNQIEKAIQYNTNEEPIIISKPTSDRLLKLDRPADAMALYWFYYYTAKWQHSSTPHANNHYVTEGLKWSGARLNKAKKDLISLGLIEQPERQWSPTTKKIGFPCIKINFIWWNKDRLKSYTPNLLPPTKSYPVGNSPIKGSTNILKEEETNILKRKESLSPKVEHFVKKFYAIQKEQFPNFIKQVSPTQIKQSCDAIDKLVRIDGFTLVQVFKAIVWATDDEFWARQVLSITGLRSRSKNGMTKFQNILAGMGDKNKQPTKGSPPQQPEHSRFPADNSEYGNSMGIRDVDFK